MSLTEITMIKQINKKAAESKKFLAIMCCLFINLIAFFASLGAMMYSPEISGAVTSITTALISAVAFAISIYCGGQSAIDYKTSNSNNINYSHLEEIKK